MRTTSSPAWSQASPRTRSSFHVIFTLWVVFHVFPFIRTFSDINLSRDLTFSSPYDIWSGFQVDWVDFCVIYIIRTDFPIT